MRNYPQCIASSPVLTSAVFFLAAAHIPCIYSVIVSLDLPKVTISNATELPIQPTLRPFSVSQNSLLHLILSRLCKLHNNSLCINLNSSVSQYALLPPRPTILSDLEKRHKQKQNLEEQLSDTNVSLKPQVSGNRPEVSSSPYTSRSEFLKKMRGVSSEFISVFLPNKGKRGHFRYNKKIFVYGEDTRTPVSTSKMRRYPFSNVVRLSSGCTGTLLTQRHVLTAAHCVHNGEFFRNNLQMLKIEVPDTMGFRVYYIEKISIPKPWLRRTSMGATLRSSYDYAVVKLSHAVPRRKRFMPLSVPKANILNEDTFFFGFTSPNDPLLWSSQCQSQSNMALMDGHLLLTRCDSAVGNSGAAVFTDDPREGRKIIGIISNTRSVAMGMSFVTRYSIITALTWNKLYEICSMTFPDNQYSGVCPTSFNYRPDVPNEPVDNRILPFFG